MPLNRGPLDALFSLGLQALGFSTAWSMGQYSTPLRFNILTPLTIPSGPRLAPIRLGAFITTAVLSVSMLASAQTPAPTPPSSIGEGSPVSSSVNTPLSATTTGSNASEPNNPIELSVKGQATAASAVTPKTNITTNITPSSAPQSPKITPESAPKWADLTATQQLALQPLNVLWSTITSAHKRKWIALVANFADLPAKNQEKLQQRMNQWASLSAQERAQARVIFSQVQQLSGDDRLSKWQAYQALEPSQKNQLAQSTQMLPNSAAISPAPITSRPVESIHLLFSQSFSSSRLEVDQLSSKTLLPPKVQAPAP